MKLIAYSAGTLSKLLGDIRLLYAQHGRVSCTVSTAKPRTIDQNSLSHAWYQQVADELREDSPLGVKRYCKLTIGVPILRCDDDEFRAGYDRVIRPLSYELKLEAMDILPVTSRMTTKQLTTYLENMQAHYQTRGVQLAFPMERAA